MSMLNGCAKRGQDAIAPRALFTARGAGIRRALLKRQALEMVTMDREARCKADMDAAAETLDASITRHRNLYRGYLESILEMPEGEMSEAYAHLNDGMRRFGVEARSTYRKKVDRALRGSRMLREVSP